MKLSNEVLSEALNLEETIKAAQKRLDEIRDALKEKGSFATKEFVVAVSETSRKQMAGAKIVLETLKLKEEEALRQGILNVVTYKTVKIARKEVA